MKLTLSTIEEPVADLVERVSSCFCLDLLDFQSLRKVWQLRTGSGYKYLKRSRLERNDIIFIFEALEYLYHQGFRCVPRLQLSQTGLPYVEDQGDLYILTDWFLSQELDFQNETDLKEAAQLLAVFHLKAEGFIPSTFNHDRNCWLNWPAKLETRLEQLTAFRRLALEEKETSSFSRLYLRYFEPFYRQAVASFEALLDSPYWEIALRAANLKSLCHHDYSSRNILRTGDNQLVLVDFDYLLQDIRLHDLINLLVRNLKHNEWNINLYYFILHQYHQVYPLSAAEIKLMYILLSWPQDFWQVGLQYYYEKLPWPKERFLKKLENRIKHRSAQDRFLAELLKDQE